MKLNRYCELRRSGIHGWGIFASRDIPKGKKIIQYKGEKISPKEGERRAEKQKKEGAIYIFTLNDKYDIDGSVDGSGAQFMNHSCSPNCESVNYDEKEIWIESIKDIKKGQELFYDYGFDDKEIKCLCNNKGCKGHI